VSTTLDAVLRSWAFDPWLVFVLLVTAGLYGRGWLVLHRRNQERWHAGQLCAFWGGLAVIGLALMSPIEPFAALLLQVHMLQHLLLMMAAPPLLWLGAPMFPMLLGLPRPVRTYWVAPLFRSPALRHFFARLTHPTVALTIFAVVTWLWHAPTAYELALRSGGWHFFQHLSFLGGGLLFWYPVIRPYPSHPRWSRWLLFPYLILADLQNTALSALLTFSGRVFYPYYLQVPRLGGLSPLDDQSAAGVLMWVPGSLAFLVPLFGIGNQVLLGQKKDWVARRQRDRVTGSVSAGTRVPLPVLQSLPAPVILSPGHPGTLSYFDLLRVPLLARFLKWRHARLALQLPLLALAAVLIVDGLRGPQMGAMNLAGVLPWIHWRGLLILSLLVAGNFFCMACPFLLPRTLARRWMPVGRSWPRWLRGKWLAIMLIVLFLWAYEAFSLWDSPWWTAWLVLSYFALALVIDGFFRGAAFCKYLCPIGQFNFVQSLVSPLEVKVLNPKVCAACPTKDCIRGTPPPAANSPKIGGDSSITGRGIPGCELHLFQPRKIGNMDCTFCLDCVHACPHDNIGILARPPLQDLWQERPRSGIGRFSKRTDLAVLIVVLVFGAFANAAGMVGPVREWQDQLSLLLGQTSPLLVTSLFYLVALVALPLLAVGSAACLSRRWGQLRAGWIEIGTRFSCALVPLGFSMWLAHYGFHLFTSYDTIVPTTQRFAGDLGWTILGEPHWVASCCRTVAEWLPRLEILILDVGLLLSLYVAYRLAQVQEFRPPHILPALAPWILLIVLLFSAGIWLVLQPMQMRGTL
jgi:cytochrome c oxidase assembly factor CtaG/polyferredoxin